MITLTREQKIQNYEEMLECIDKKIENMQKNRKGIQEKLEKLKNSSNSTSDSVLNSVYAEALTKPEF